MKVVLFIGHHKVGSTSLQDFLSRNAVPLARAGILYPSVDFEGMALMLAAAVTGRDQEESLPINAREPHNALAFRMLAEHRNGKVPPFHKGLPSTRQMFRAIGKQIEFLTPHTVILVAEVFANFAPVSPDLITRLTGQFPGADITVIASLRRVDEYLASWHGQRLKFDHKLAPLRDDAVQGYFGGIHFDYRLMLKGWIEALPEAQVILRDYSQVQAAGGSVADFITQAGLKLPDGLVPERRSNQSLHRGVYEVARLGNAALPPPLAGQLRRFLRQATPKLGLPPSGDIEMFGAANRQIMAERFAPVHDYLGQVAGKRTFFKDQREVVKIQPVPEMDVFRQALDGVFRRRQELADTEIQDFLAGLKAGSTKPTARP